MKTIFTLLTFCLCALPGATFAADSDRSYPIPDRGKLVVPAPQAWVDKLNQPPNKLPPTVRFSGKPDGKFEVLVTALWSVRQDANFKSAASVRRMVEQAATGAASQAVERSLPIVEVTGASGPGFYFSATDRAPKPGEYKYLTQGAIAVGDLVLTFTALTNEANAPEVKAMLEMLRGARHANPT